MAKRVLSIDDNGATLFIRVELKSKCHLNNSIEGDYPVIKEHVVLFKVVSINERDSLVFL